MTSAGKRTLGACAVLGLLTLIAYSGALDTGYIWDDTDYLVENPTLRSAEGLGQIWFEFGATPQYYPMVFTTFWVECRLWGLENPGGFHFVNIILHAAGAMLLYLLLCRLKIPGTWLAAAIFALHPVHVESVAWITERKNVLSGVFYFATILAFLAYARLDTEQPYCGPRKWLITALVCFAIALLSKTTVCVLPAVILLIVWWQRGRIGVRDGIVALPFFALGLLMAGVTVLVERSSVGAQGAHWSLTLLERCLLAGRIFWFYLAKLVWPHPINFVYHRWTIDAAVWWQFLFPMAAAALLIAAFLLRHRIGRGPAAALFYYAGVLFPVMGFFNVYYMRYSYVADHFFYLPSIGPIVLIAAGLTLAARHLTQKQKSDAPKRGRKAKQSGPLITWPRATAGVVLIVLLALTFQRGLAYENEETIWRDTLDKNPTAWLAHINMARILQDRGELDEAIEHLQTAIKHHPREGDLYTELGLVHARKGNAEPAMAAYETALEIQPDRGEVHSNLGVLYLENQRLDDAIIHLEKAAALAPDDGGVRANLAAAYWRNRELDKAAATYREAVKRIPDAIPIRIDLGKVLIAADKLDEARAVFEEILRLDPGNPTAQQGLQRLRAGG